MALITIDAVVDVSAHACMICVRLRFQMAVRAREHAVIRRICMARRADAIGSAMIGWKPGVIEGRALPRRRAVAGIAGGREAGSRMVWIRGALVILLVAAVAGSRQGRVVVIHVAARAGRSNVSAGEREGRVVVIERGGNPGTRVVANIARSRET